MNCWLEIHRRAGIEKRHVAPGESVGIANGACPGCQATPFRVQGGNLRIHDDQTWVANGRCVDCGDPVGYLYARANTLFGFLEDAAVLEHGRGRVYHGS